MTDASNNADRYFAGTVVPAEGVVGRWVELSEIAPIQFMPGLVFRPVLGDRVLVNFVTYEPNTVVPLHAHTEEQLTFVIEGEFEFELDGNVRTLRPGTVAHIPAGVPHAARTRDSPCTQIDVFAPPRSVLVEAMTRLEGAS